MIPVRLQIKGFLSYYDPVDLDFTGFDMACISGSNGAGKSSLLDAITWVLFGEARRNDDAVINHRAQSPKVNKPAEVILDFDYENARYRVQRSKFKGKTTTLEFYIRAEDESWKPLTEATLRATEERIRQTLRLDYETFINASFFLQGKADQFAQQRPADRKRILASILGLEVWEKYKDEAYKRRRAHELDLANVEGILAEYASELNEEEERKSALKSLQQEHETQNALAQASKQILDQQRLIADRLEGDKAQLEKQSSEIKRLQAELDQKLDDLRDRQEEQKEFRLQIASEAEIRAGHAAWLEQQKKLAELDAVAANFHQYESKRQAPLLKIEGERASLQAEFNALNSKEAEIESLQSRLVDLQKQVEEARQAVAADEAQLAMRSVLEKDMQELQAEKARAKAENAVLKIEMDELAAHRKELQEIQGANCPTCEKPLQEAEKQHIIDDLTARGTQKAEVYRKNLKFFEQVDAQYREKETALASLQRVDADLKLQQRLLDSKSEELARSQAEIEKWQTDGFKRIELLRASLKKEDFAADARTQLAEIDKELKKLGYDAETHTQIRTAVEAGRDYQNQLLKLEGARSALVPLEREIETLGKSIDSSEKHLLMLEKEYESASRKLNENISSSPDLADLERKYRDLQEQVNTLLTRVGYARNRVDVLDDVKKQKAAKEEEKQEILKQIAQLKMLEKAFGKDGIPALLIEQSLPEIEEHANEILDRLSSGMMRLTFATQREYRDSKREDRKETLDIMISSSAEERAYELFSGGEAFRINFALRLALSRMLAHRAGARLSTLVIDEGFGSQDAEGRQRLIEAINYVRDEFSKIIVITHLEELKDAFSARIEVTKEANGSQVQVVAA
jgi:DNA repair protein SbcC/Rad50